MRKNLIILALLALPLMACATTDDTSKTGSVVATTTASETTLISVSAKGDDVRDVLHTIFTQTKKNYVLEPGVRFVLYLSLDKVPFDEALMIICKNASLKIDQQDGIYYVNRAPAKVATTTTTTTPATTTTPDKPKQQEKPKGMLPQTVLQKRVTTRFAKVEIKALFADLAKQTEVTIDVDASVPNLKLDAFLLNTSLKYALDQVTQAAGLQYRFTDNLSIQIFKPKEESNHVSLLADTDK